MIRIDPSFFYRVGAAIRPLTTIEGDATKSSVFHLIYTADHWLTSLLEQTIIPLKTSSPKGRELLQLLKTAEQEFNNLEQDDWSKPLGWHHSFPIKSAATEFETLFSGEMQFADAYFVTKKKGYDTTELTENGVIIFPSDLPTKVPETIQDAKAAARCIAFELPTAAAFHLHRLNELVLRKYYDLVTNGKSRPEHRNIGAYIDAMRNHQVGDKVVFSALTNVAKFHRNPVLHPDDQLSSVEDAISLLGTINTVIAYMLKSIPPPRLELTAPTSADESKATKI